MNAAANGHQDFELPQRLLAVGVVLVVILVLPGLAHPFATPKEAVVALVSAFTLFAAAIAPQPRLRQWPGTWNAILLAPIAAVTASAVVNAPGLLASDGAMRFWCYAVFVLAVRLACPAAGDAQRLVRLIAGLGGIEGALVVLQVLAGDSVIDASALPSMKWRAFGTLGNPNWVGAFLAATLPLALAYGQSVNARDRIVWRLAAAAIASGLILTVSRGAWLAAASGVIVLLALSSERMWHRLIVTCIAAVVLAAVVALSRFDSATLTDALTRTASMTGRLRMWEATTRLIAARPLLGWGPGRFAGAYPAFQRASLRHDAAGTAVTDLTDHPHNDYLFLAAEAGGIALAAFIALLTLVLRQAARRGAPRELPAVAAALVALGVHGLVDVPLRLPATTVLFCLLVVAVLQGGPRGQSFSTRLLSPLERIGLVVVMALCLAQSTRLLLVDRWLQGSRLAFMAGQSAEAERLALRALRFEPMHGELWGILAHARAQHGDDEGALRAARTAQHMLPTANGVYLIVAIERRRGRNEQAIEELEILSETVPGLLRPRVLLAESYAEAGRRDTARTMLAEVLAMPAKFPSAEERQLRDRAAGLLRELSSP